MRRFFQGFVTFAILGASVSFQAMAEERSWTVVSPDGTLSAVVSLAESSGTKANHLFYRVDGPKNENILPSAPLGLQLKRLGSFEKNLRFLGQSTATVDRWYDMPVGKRSRCHEKANELTLTFANATDERMDLIVRAADDGIAYRYKVDGSGKDTVICERSGFHIPPGSRGLFAEFQDKAYYEWEFLQHSDCTAIGFPIAVPALFHTPRGWWVYVTEADVRGTYAGGHLRFVDAKNGILSVELPEQPTGDLPWTTPWRVAMMGRHLKTLVESTLILDLNPPSEISDAGWIKPGVAIFPWATGPGTNNSSLERMKQFVDLAKEMGWTWIEFDNALVLGNQLGDPPSRWMTATWIPELVKYAASQGINVYGWDHRNNLDTPEKRELILGYLVKHGFKGIKVDFLDSDSQERFQFRDTIAKECADRKLLLSFHGETMPRGQQRRWPHIATLEGVKGEEYNLFTQEDHRLTSIHNVNLVFTRNIVGSMDYTPCGFELRRRTTTDAHEIALAVVFESGWQCMCVSPESMKGNPAKGFLRNLPSTWDDIHFVDGAPGEFAVVARRKGADWYLAGINAKQARDVNISLDFLKPGVYRVELYRDGVTKDGKTPIVVESREVDTSQPLVVSLAVNGGFGVKFEKMAREPVSP